MTDANAILVDKKIGVLRKELQLNKKKKKQNEMFMISQESAMVVALCRLMHDNN